MGWLQKRAAVYPSVKIENEISHKHVFKYTLASGSKSSSNIKKLLSKQKHREISLLNLQIFLIFFFKMRLLQHDGTNGKK